MSGLSQIEEIQILLGLKDKAKEIEKIIKDIKTDNIILLIEKVINDSSITSSQTDSLDSSQGEMYSDFASALKIDNIGKVDFKSTNQASNFLQGFSNNSVPHPKGSLSFSKEFRQILNKGDFSKVV